MKLLIVLVLLAGCNSKTTKSKGVLSGGFISNGQPDPLAAYMWHTKNLGQTNFSSTTALSGKDANLGTTHSTYLGTGINIVISDSRVDLNHQDIFPNAYASVSRNYNSASPYIGSPTTSDNSDSHGTAVTGIIGAVKDNGIGAYGIAPKAKLIGTNFIDSDQSASKMTDQAWIPQARIFNYSWGSKTCEVTPLRTDFFNTVRNRTLHFNNVYVTAVGNDYISSAASCGGSGNYRGNGNLDQWKSYPYAVVVGASNSQGESASYSAPSANIWITAPGGDSDGLGILSPDLEGCANGYAVSASTNLFDKNSNGLNSNCNYVMETTVGTSFASPIVTGAVALITEANPSLTWRDIKHILASTAIKIDPTDPGWVTNGAGFHFHSFFGFGQLDIEAAVNMAVTKPFDLLNMKETINSYDSITHSAYRTNVTNTPIPDNNATGISSTLNVDLHDLVIEHVQVKVNIGHSASQDLEIKLTSPSGRSAVLMASNSNINEAGLSSVTLGANVFYGERSKGNWTLTVADKVLSDTGTLGRWSVRITGHKPTLADVTPPAPVTGLGSTGNLVNWTASASGDVIRYESCVVRDFLNGTREICADHDWMSLGNVVSKTFIYKDGELNSQLVSGSTYVAYIRAIDTSENESTIAEQSWVQP